MTRAWFGSALLLLFAILVATSQAVAQTATTEGDPWADLEEFVVVGSRGSAEALLSQGNSVIGFDTSELAAIGADDVSDLAAFTPNLEIRGAGGGAQSTFFIRGVGLADFSANASGSIAIYQDDIPINAPAIQLGPIFDVEGVTVLRGPEGGTQHRNASAGVIKIRSKRPTGELGGYLTSSFGNYDLRQFEGALETPIIPELLSARVAFKFTERDGWTTNRCAGAPPADQRVANVVGSGVDASICGEPVSPSTLGTISDIPVGLPKNVNDEGNWAARGILRFQPTINDIEMDWVLVVDGMRRDQDTPLGQAIGLDGIIPDADGNISPPSALQNQFGGTVRTYRDNDVLVLENSLKAQFPRETFPAPRGRRQLNFVLPILASRLAKSLDLDAFEGDFNRVGDSKLETWGASLRGDVPFTEEIELTSVTGFKTYHRENDTDSDYTPLTIFESLQEDDAWQVTQELRLVARLDYVTFETGGLVLREDLDVTIENLRLDNFNNLEIDPPTVFRTRDYSQKTFNAGVYARFEWELKESFIADAGARYNFEKKDFDYEFVEPLVENRVATDNSWDHVTYDVRFRYVPTEDASFYMKFTHGWRSGHFNATANGITGVTPAKPEKIDSWEAGFDTSWLDGRLAIQGAAFFYRYSDYQVFVTNRDFDANPVPEQVITNAEDATVYGVELTLDAEPLERLRLQVNFGWLESEFTEFVDRRLVQFFTPGAPAINQEISEDFSGNPLPNSAEFSVSLSAEYDVELGRIGTLTPGYYASWTDDVVFDQANGRGLVNNDGQTFIPEHGVGQKAYWIHNVRLQYKTQEGHVAAAGWVRNLTNEVYKVFAFENGSYVGNLVGAPRTYGVDLTLRW